MKKPDKNKRLNNILIICNENVNPEGLSGLFESNGFTVNITDMNATVDNWANYGAVAHVSYSEQLLEDRLNDRVNQIADEEWILIAGEDDEDLHCTVELTKHASDALRIFVKSIWARFNTP